MAGPLVSNQMMGVRFTAHALRLGNESTHVDRPVLVRELACEASPRGFNSRRSTFGVTRVSGVVATRLVPTQ